MLKVFKAVLGISAKTKGLPALVSGIGTIMTLLSVIRTVATLAQNLQNSGRVYKSLK